MKIIRYNPSLKQAWDDFVETSKNATFLLKRDYMDYHADRFTDCSLLLTDDSGKRILALLPATIHAGNMVKSHGGLTYGGFLMSDTTAAHDPMNWFDAVKAHYKEMGITDLYYKPIPHIYHKHPAEEDLYALFRNNATLCVRNLATVIDLRHRISSSRLTKRAEKRGRLGNITTAEVNDVNLFWDIIVNDRRVRHNTVPVHTAAELDRLHRLFPDNIRFFIANTGTETLAGAVIYVANNVLHLQYAAATQAGKDLYATDVLYHDIIFNHLSGAEYFDFGTSNEDDGRFLNTGMIKHKEEFGGRSVVYDTYHITLKE